MAARLQDIIPCSPLQRGGDILHAIISQNLADQATPQGGCSMLSVTILNPSENNVSPFTRTPLRAGPLSLVYDKGDLRYVTCGEYPILLRLYAALRDRDWQTVRGVSKTNASKCVLTLFVSP